MKTILALSILFSAIALPALGALTDADLNEIRLIVKEEIDVKIKESEERTKVYIDLQIKSVKEHIDTQIESVTRHIDLQTKSVTGNINTQMESVDKRLSLVTTLIGGLIALIVLAVGIPQILMVLRSRRDESLEKQIEILTQEIETLKRQQIVQP